MKRTIVSLLVGAVIAVLAFHFIVYAPASERTKKAEEKARQAEATLAKSKADWEVKEQAYLETQKEEKALRKQLQDDLNLSEAERASILAKLINALKPIPTMPPTTLLGEINFHIENQAKLREGELYELTRHGAELSLKKFKERDSFFSLNQRYEEENIKLKDMNASKTRELNDLTISHDALKVSFADAENTITKKDEVIFSIKKEKKSSRWKGRLEGFLSGLALAGGISLVSK